MAWQDGTEDLPAPAAVRKAEREIAEFREYQRLGRDLVEFNEKICRLRPVQEPSLSEQKKTAEAIQREVACEVEQLLRTIFTGVRKTGHVDLEAIEMLVRSARCLAPVANKRAIASYALNLF